MSKRSINNKEQKEQIPIVFAKVGETVTVDNIQSGEHLRHRLAEIGITQGTTLTIIRNQARGPIVVKVKGSNIILGTGMSFKIFVHNVDNEEQ